MINQQRGNTLIEVLIVTTMITLVMTSIVAGLSFSIRNTAEGKYREYAAIESQKAMEVFKRERVVNGWKIFQGQMAILQDTICLNTLPDSFENFGGGSSCSDGYAPAGMGTEYQREAIIDSHDDQVDITITMQWLGSEVDYDPDGIKNTMVVKQEFHKEF